MIIEPKIRGFICTAAHPQGCHQHVLQQQRYITQQARFHGPKNALVVGASTGYGLASRLALGFGANTQTIGVFFEKAAQGKRTATAGWYNTAAFERLAAEQQLYAKSVNGDAFSDEVKQQVAELIRRDFGQLECLVYSLASPRRQHPDSGELLSSVLKPIAKSYSNKTVDPMTGVVKDVSMEPATQDEVDNTVAVMGGDDWQRWVDFLQAEGLLAEGFTTVGYSYIGPELTYPIYTHGTIGQAKAHMQQTADQLHEKLQTLDGQAWLSVNKALVTQSSSAIPVVPLYMSILFKVMQEQGTNEHCIEQMHRLFADHLYSGDTIKADDQRRIRLDDLEMLPEVQQQVAATWSKVNSENIHQLSRLDLYQRDFHRLFGFEFDEVDYSADVDPAVSIPSLEETQTVE